MIRKTLKLLLIVLVFSFHNLYAQTVRGKVIDANDNSPIPGISVIVKGSTIGTTTDFNGNYSLKLNKQNSILQFSFLGYTTKEVAVNGRTVINVTLQESAEVLQEVVITALGIKRERKSLGYAVQELKGAQVAETREANVANALAGKVTGVRIVKGSNGPASSSKIILRGFGSLAGDNQPLIVVDGIPMDNFTGANNNDFWNPGTDLGNGLGDINSEDIESISVLKGASAAALYGSRAGNGVILITTKTGKVGKGLGISYSSSIGVSTLFMTPKLQNNFGQGTNGIYTPDNSTSNTSWGVKIENQTVKDVDGNSFTYGAFDNIKNYYKTGFSKNHTVSFQNQLGENSSLYTSMSYLEDESHIPGAELEKLNLTARGVSKFGNDKWTLDTKVQYANLVAKNRPLNGFNTRNAFGTVALLPRSVDITRFKNTKDQYGIMRWYQTSGLNPYWLVDNYLTQDARDRFLLMGSLKNQLTNWLSAELKLGADLYTTNSQTKIYAGSPNYPSGRYGTGKNTSIEKNYSVNLVASKDNLFGKLGGSLTLGGNLMHKKGSGIYVNAGDLEVPDLFSLKNGVKTPEIDESVGERKMNSLYGLLQINYDNYLFFDVTARNDWTSTLSKANRSFFYPSVSTSFVISDMITKQGGDLPNWLTFAKIRASYAEVGNDLDPYKLYNVYSIAQDPNNNTTATTNTTLFNKDLKNELIKSVELGFEGRFFKNRLSLDFAWYKSNAINQLIEIPRDPLSGYNFEQVNAGNIQNTGIELTVNGHIIKNEDEGFNWNAAVNITQNKNTIEELLEDVKQYKLGGFDNLAILAEVGEDYGVIKGTKFNRVEDETSPFFGRLVVSDAGLPEATKDKYVLGSQQPDMQIGFTNTFMYKNFTLSFLIDASIGGEIFSGTNTFLQSRGNAAKTVVNGERENFVVDAVVSDGSGGYTENTVEISPQQYWRAVTSASGNLGINEANVYDATNVRLRTISLNYALPKKWLKNTFFQGLKFGVSANNVWMINSKLDGIDPESVFATGSNAIGFEMLSSPTTRSMFLNVSANF